MGKALKVIMNIIQNLLITIGVLVILTFVAPRIFGIHPFIVLSGSMENEIKTGAVAYADTKAKVEDVKIGDIIVFKVGESQVTHRVIAINDNNTFITKGDANATEDLAPVKFEDFGGQTIFSIPYLGYVLQSLQTRTGIFVVLVTIGLNILYFIFSPEDEKKKNKKEKNKVKNKDENEKEHKNEDVKQEHAEK